MSQYMHDRWGSERGFPGGTVFAISQSQDGYLWIGTERGLVRFDGLEFTLIQRPIPGSPQTGAVRGLVADASGNLWIRLDGPHLLRYRDGHFEDAMIRFDLQEYTFTSMSIDRQGELLLWGPQNKLMRFHGGAFTHTGIAQDIRNMVTSVVETADRKVWLGTRGAGLYEADKERVVNTSSQLALTSVNSLLPAVGGGMWIGTDSGLRLWDGHTFVNSAWLSSLSRLQVLSVIQDEQGNIWAGTNDGLMRIAPDLTVSAQSPHRQAETISAVYEDREGGIWFGGARGLERLRDGVFTTYSVAQGLPALNNGPVYVDDAGRTWFAPSSGGLDWLDGGRVRKVTADALDQDVVYSISGGGGEIWVGRQHGGLTMLTVKAGSLIAKTYTEADGLAQNSIYAVHRNRDGSVWAATVSNGVSRLSNRRFTNYSVANGLLSNAVFSILEASNGTMWFATPSGLESLAHGQWKSYAPAEGLPSPNVKSIYEDSQHVLWIATTGGLAYLVADHVDVPHSLTNSLRDEILGISEDNRGSLWIVTSDHVLQVDRDRLLDGTLSGTDVQSYGPEDGLPDVEGVRRERSIVAAPDGRIWISLMRGLGVTGSVASKRHLPLTVRIESFLAEGKPVQERDNQKLGAGTHSVTFNYASSDLDMPQRVKFRYRLDGSDRDWSEEVGLRQVVYTNLGPGRYRFRIVAFPFVGPGSGPETTISFFVQPVLWQTWWFRIFCLVCLCLLGFLTIRLRMAQLTERLNTRFQDRLAERTLIAQELHDTLLQGVLSASMQLDVVEDQTPSDSPTKPMIRRILQLMGQVTEEGRGALRGLRAPANNSDNLELALSRVQDEFALGGDVKYRVISGGESRPLQPIIRDEAYRIGREAVTNAFLHAGASNIEVEVEYADGFLRLLVRDDGCGMNSDILKAGREGHWGLPGMHERSRKIGATLKLRSRTGAGTEVELTIPNSIAFASRSQAPWSQWRPWLTRERFSTRSRATRKGDQK